MLQRFRLSTLTHRYRANRNAVINHSTAFTPAKSTLTHRYRANRNGQEGRDKFEQAVDTDPSLQSE